MEKITGYSLLDDENSRGAQEKTEHELQRWYLDICSRHRFCLLTTAEKRKPPRASWSLRMDDFLFSVSVCQVRILKPFQSSGGKFQAKAEIRTASTTPDRLGRKFFGRKDSMSVEYARSIREAEHGRWRRFS